VGSRFRSRGRQLGQQLEDRLTVVEYAPPERFAFTSTGRGGTFRHAFIVEAATGGAMLTKVMEPLSMRFPLSLFLALTNRVLSKRMAGDLERIAACLESQR
jgi:hypothetical protein